jgi:long-subunit acyl-CoA synthetase (AMP-forming)
MYPGAQAKIRPQAAGFGHGGRRRHVTYAELGLRSNRLAHFLRASGLRRLDRYAIFIENNARYVEYCGAGECVGLYYTCINSYLTPESPAWGRCRPRYSAESRTEFAEDSSLEEAVLSELVSEPKFPASWEYTGYFVRRDLRVDYWARNPAPNSTTYNPIPYGSEQGTYFCPTEN